MRHAVPGSELQSKPRWGKEGKGWNEKKETSDAGAKGLVRVSGLFHLLISYFLMVSPFLPNCQGFKRFFFFFLESRSIKGTKGTVRSPILILPLLEAKSFAFGRCPLSLQANPFSYETTSSVTSQPTLATCMTNVYCHDLNPNSIFGHGLRLYTLEPRLTEILSNRFSYKPLAFHVKGYSVKRAIALLDDVQEYKFKQPSLMRISSWWYSGCTRNLQIFLIIFLIS